MSTPVQPRLKVPEQKVAKLPSEKIGPELLGVDGSRTGLIVLPHQVDAFNFIVPRLEKNLPTYLGADPGLGKTIVAALLSNRFEVPFFYVCPPFLTMNTTREFEKWGWHKRLRLLPDSLIARRETFEEVKASITEGAILVVDEAHRFKNLKAQRTKALLKSIVPLFKGRVVYMSGTPMPNSRPLELWPILRTSAPKVFGYDFFPFALKYCGAFKAPFGWDFSGFTNRKEFKARITKSFMLRQKKELLNLPPKREGLLVVGEGMKPESIEKVERAILSKYDQEDVVSGDVLEFFGVEGDVHLASYLRMLGSFKLKYALPVIEDLLENTKEDLLIFAVHKEVIRTLEKALTSYSPLVITGDVNKRKRQALVNEFQENKERRVFIGNIQACGVGFTLTKATRVLFVEFSWVDGDNTQASDRVHRIGQNKSVLVQYVVLNGSIDHKRMETVLKKRSLSI